MGKSKVDKDTGEVSYYFRHPLERVRHQTVVEGESMTHQSHAESCDINQIIARYDRTGELPRGRNQGVYADVTQLQGDLTERAVNAKEVIKKADEHVRSTRRRKEEQQQLDLEAAKKELEDLRAVAAKVQAGGPSPKAE